MSIVKLEVKASEIAKMTGLSARTIKRYAAAGVIPAFRINRRGDYRFTRKDVESFMGSLKIEVEQAPARGRSKK